MPRLATLAFFILFISVKLSAMPVSKIFTAGGAHTCAVLADGISLKCWGLNDYGQLGLGDTEARSDEAGETVRSLPTVDLGNFGNILDVQAGGDFTCVLNDQGIVACFGANDHGQLGIGDTQARGDQPGEMGSRLSQVPLGIPAKGISLGERFACALLNDRSVKCWGSNEFGQLGQGMAGHVGDAPGEVAGLAAIDLAGKKVRRISAGAMHACALFEDGTASCWGYNDYGQLGYEDQASRGLLAGDMGANLPVIDLGQGVTIRDLHAKFVDTCALTESDEVFCWGYNEDGRLGAGHILGVGDQIGTMGENMRAVQFDTGLDVSELSCGARSCCATFLNHATKCWGFNLNGELGLGDRDARGGEASAMGENLPYVNFGLLTSVAHIEMGDTHGCVEIADLGLKCWGANTKGQLGYADQAGRGHRGQTMGDGLMVVEIE